MTRTWLIVSVGALSFGVAACGDGYDEKNVAYNDTNAAYDEAGNAAYDETGNAAYAPADGNAGYTQPVDNMSTNNVVGETPPPAETTTNKY